MNGEPPSPRLDSFQADGFLMLAGIVPVATIHDVIAALDHDFTPSPNRRSLLCNCPAVNELAASHALKATADSLLGGDAFPVRAILFDKVAGANWGLSWHQDTAIAVADRRDVPGFVGWSVKQGVTHVHPPAGVLEHMAALRVHLDDCGGDNGPLRIIPGSHRHGKLSQEQIDAIVRDGGEVICTARRGDVLAIRPLLLHASSKAMRATRRRVVHIEYACDSLPGGLNWQVEGRWVPAVP